MFTEDLTTFFDIEGFAIPAVFEDVTRPEAESLGTSLSCHGNWLVSNGGGCVVIFNKQAGDWKQTQILQGSELNQDFGYSVSINGDYLAVSSPSLNTVHIFKNVNSVWTHVFDIEQDESTGNDLFGNSVSVIGSYVVIASKGHNSNQGAVYTFLRDVNDEFTQIDKLEDPLLSFFGKKIIFDGETLIVESEHYVHAFLFVVDHFEDRRDFLILFDPIDIAYYDHTLVILAGITADVYTRVDGAWNLKYSIPVSGNVVQILNDRIFIGSSTNLYEYQGYSSYWSLVNTDEISVISISATESGIFFGTDDFQIYDYVTFSPLNYISKYFTTNVIFDHEHVSVSNADLVYDGYKPTILCKTVEVEQFDYGSLVTVENTVFKIISKQQDGTGVSTIILHKGS